MKIPRHTGLQSFLAEFLSQEIKEENFTGVTSIVQSTARVWF